MPVYCVWDTPDQTIMRIYFEVPWTWEGYHAERTRAEQEMRSVDHPIGCILELPDQTNIGPQAMTGDTMIGDSRPDNLVVLVIVTDKPILQGLIEIIARLSPSFAAYTTQATTLDEAREIIHQRLNQA